MGNDYKDKLMEQHLYFVTVKNIRPHQFGEEQSLGSVKPEQSNTNRREQSGYWVYN